MKTRLRIHPAVLENAGWFLVSLAMAFFVWVVAVTQSDPIQQRQFLQIPIHIDPDPGLSITGTPQHTARVNVRAQKSVLDVLTPDDINVSADVAGLKAGTYVVELKTQVARRASADPQPAQITVTLEDIQSRQVKVQAKFAADPPPGFEHDDPTFARNQVLVTGAASKVSQVVAAQVALDLSQQRNPLQQDAKLVPVDVDGNIVNDVTIDPQVVNVTVNVRQRDDVKQVPVMPNILVGSLPDGYILTSISYSPKMILVSGTQTDLSSLPSTFFTTPIDLTDHRSNFEVSVPVQLPSNNLLPLSGQDVTVSIGISAPTANRQFDNVPVSIIGLPSGYQATLVPSTVTVLVTGPQPVVNVLQASDLQVVVDLSKAAEGKQTVVPVVSVKDGQLAADNLSILPADLDVEIVPVAESTPTPQ